MVALAANLRPAVSSVGPLLDEISNSLELSPAQVSLLSTAPVLCFGVFAAVAPLLARRVRGFDVTVTFSLALLGIGLLLRPLGDYHLLLAGTVLASGAIAVMNVALPALTKRDFAASAALVTGGYSVPIGLGAAFAAALSAPLATFLGGWRASLAAWAIPVALALLIWLSKLTRSTCNTSDDAPGAPLIPRLSVLQCPSAWLVTMYFGLQSLTYYSVLAWLPALTQARGVSQRESGLLLSVALVTGTVSALATAASASRTSTLRGQAVFTALLTLVGFAGFAWAGTSLFVACAAILGLGQGGAFPVALTMMVTRATSAAESADLSAMSQTFGYLFAAMGPIMIAFLFTTNGSWGSALVALMLLTALQAILGTAAGSSGPACPGTPERGKEPSQPQLPDVE